MARQVLERAVEEHLVKRCSSIGVMCLKFTSPGHIGVPDRLLLGRDPRGLPVALFLELKRPGQTPRPSQVQRMAQMVEHGATVRVADSAELVDALLDHYFSDGPEPPETTTPPAPERTGAALIL